MTALRRFRCTSDRIGRHHARFVFEVDAADAQDLAEALHAAVGKHLLSADYEVTVDLDRGVAWIGWGRFGSLQIEELGAGR